MKAKIILLIILSSLILGCSTKRKDVSFTKEAKTEIEKIKVDSAKETKQEQKQIEKTNIKSSEKKEDLKTDVSIIGKTDNSNPFQYHNILNGDTLQTISIFGNADFKINNHYAKSEKKIDEKKEVEKLNIIQEVARKSVAKETIKEVAAEVKKVDKQIKEKSFTLGAWLTWIACFGIVAIIIGILIYFKKYRS